MPPLPALPLFAALLLLSPPAATAARRTAPAVSPAPAAASSSRELWYGIFLGGRRAGYLARERRAGVTYGGKGGTSRATYTRMRLHLEVRAQGKAVTTRKERQAWTTPAGAPLEEVETAEGSGVKRVVRAVYSGRSVAYTADLGDGSPPRTGTLTIGPDEAFYARDPFDVSTAAAGGSTDGKRTVRYRDFNPDTLALEDASLSLGRRKGVSDEDADALREVIAVGGAAVRAFKTPFALDGSEGVSYEDEQGEMLRVDLGPLRIVRLPREQAAAPAAEADRPDVAEVGSCAPDKPIEDPRRLRRALYRIEGLTAPPVVEDDDVQRTAHEKRAEAGDYAALVTIDAAPLPAGDGTPLAAVPRDRFRAQLAPSLYVPAADPRIVALARKVVGDEKDAGRAAARLSAHVHKTLVYDAGAGYGPQRSAVEILNSGRGVCQDYATLLVALLRAAGVPAKHCSGLAYVDGRFYKHAWVEAWVGRWVALEPTWGEPFADATHIKLAEGEPTTDRPAASRLDALKVFVLQASTTAGESAETENAP